MAEQVYNQSRSLAQRANISHTHVAAKERNADAAAKERNADV